MLNKIEEFEKTKIKKNHDFKIIKNLSSGNLSMKSRKWKKIKLINFK